MKKYNFKHIYVAVLCLFFAVSCSEDNDPVIGPLVPKANEAQDVKTTGFTATWGRVFRGTAYQLDVSETSDFSTFLDGYNSKEITSFLAVIEELDDNTNYYYRVRGIVDGVATPNSNVVAVKTRLIPGDDLTLKGEADFFVGVAVSPERVADPAHDEVYQREFNSITAENAMKMRSIFKGLDASGNIIYDWTESDAIVDYAEDNGMNLHGHALVWHESVPDTLANFGGSNAEFESIVEDYITTVVDRYEGKVDSWDVVNEAVEEGSGGLRASVFVQKMGVDFATKCFRFARNADPVVKLFYNDFNMTTDSAKRNAALSIVDDLIAEDLIDGFGFQMHISFNFPSKEEIETAAADLVSRNLLVHFSELDVRVNASADITEFTEERSLAQSDKVRDVVEVYDALPAANKYALSIWGLKDDDSWILDRFPQDDWPLLFDEEFEKKPAFSGFIEALQN